MDSAHAADLRRLSAIYMKINFRPFAGSEIKLMFVPERDFNLALSYIPMLFVFNVTQTKSIHKIDNAYYILLIFIRYKNLAIS